MQSPLDQPALDQIFHAARTQNGWLDRQVSDELLHQIYELACLGPTMANSLPMRLVFIRTQEGKQKLAPLLMPGNLAKTMAAPVTAIVAYDLAFYEQMDKLFPVPGADMRTKLGGMPEAARAEVALMNGSLQGGYFIIAARALGLDCGPMAGFDKAKTDEAFLAGTTWKSNMLVNLGYGDPTKLFPRNPRLAFDEAVRLV